MTQDEMNLGPWALFLGGRWRRDRPTEPGTYPVATQEGDPVDPSRYPTLVKGEGEFMGRLVEKGVPKFEPGWQGWWWSRPLPSMPRGPKGPWQA